MSIATNSCRRLAAGAIGAVTVAGALLVGGAASAQAAPGMVGDPPAAVQVERASPITAVSGLATDRVPTNFAAGRQSGPMPQWWGHHWWHHHHHWWHRWWWWW